VYQVLAGTDTSVAETLMDAGRIACQRARSTGETVQVVDETGRLVRIYTHESATRPRGNYRYYVPCPVCGRRKMPLARTCSSCRDERMRRPRHATA